MTGDLVYAGTYWSQDNRWVNEYSEYMQYINQYAGGLPGFVARARELGSYEQRPTLRRIWPAKDAPPRDNRYCSQYSSDLRKARIRQT